MHIAIVTAGGAGMFCGSCMHDNTLARALMGAGAEISLIPTYTPIRVDEENLSTRRVFLGGLNVYLDYRFPFWQRLPRRLVRWLDSPRVINFATRFGISNDAHELGELTLAMLAGESGPQAREIEEFVEFIADRLKPDVVCFSNALLAGTVRSLRQRYSGPVFCTLQGDDVFLEDLIEPYRSRALDMLRERAVEFDGFLTHSRYYRDFMSGYLAQPVEKFHLVPLGIDFSGHDGVPKPARNGEFTVGYFARICPEKGLHLLIEAFRLLHAKHPVARLRAGGYLGPRDERYFSEVMREAAPLGAAFDYIGSPAAHSDKVEFFKSLDVLSVPTVYHEPKGIYVLEALANGVPVVEPRHGAFPELLEQTGGGLLVTPGNARELAEALEALLIDAKQRLALATAGHANVRRHFDPAVMAVRTQEIFSLNRLA